MRLFIALHLSNEARDAFAQAQKRLQRELVSPVLRWTRPENTHLTLLFLGEVAAEDVPRVAENLKAACATCTPFELELSSAGCFPHARRARVLWLGLDGDLDSLHSLHAHIAEQCGAFAERRDDKPFRPHLTLARIKFDDKSIARRLEETLPTMKINASRWRVESVELMSSELLPSGAEYSVVESVPLP